MMLDFLKVKKITLESYENNLILWSLEDSKVRPYIPEE